MKQKYINETLDMISEQGTSINVKLREISRRLNCVHTNFYNYFFDFNDLKWEVMRKALDMFMEYINKDLGDDLSGKDFFVQMIRNYFNFGIENPGIHRFISLDPIISKEFPKNLIMKVLSIMEFFIEVVYLLGKERISRKIAGKITKVIVSYIDGEMVDITSGRELPGDDISGRILDNALMLIKALTSFHNCEVDLQKDASKPGEFKFPILHINGKDRETGMN